MMATASSAMRSLLSCPRSANDTASEYSRLPVLGALGATRVADRPGGSIPDRLVQESMEGRLPHAAGETERARRVSVSISVEQQSSD